MLKWNCTKYHFINLARKSVRRARKGEEGKKAVDRWGIPLIKEGSDEECREAGWSDIISELLYDIINRARTKDHVPVWKLFRHVRESSSSSLSFLFFFTSRKFSQTTSHSRTDNYKVPSILRFLSFFLSFSLFFYSFSPIYLGFLIMNTSILNFILFTTIRNVRFSWNPQLFYNYRPR